jgi:hypothetical protein
VVFIHGFAAADLERRGIVVRLLWVKYVQIYPVQIVALMQHVRKKILVRWKERTLLRTLIAFVEMG